MTIFDEYKTYTGDSSISPSLLWEYDLSHFGLVEIPEDCGTACH